MRRLNLKLLLVLLLAVGIGAVSVHFLRGYNLTSSGKVLLGKAEEARQKKDWRVAVSSYSEYLHLVPNDREAQANQALAAAEASKLPDRRPVDVFRADNLLQAALRQKGLKQERDLRRELIDIQVLRGQFDEALRNIKLLSDDKTSDPDLDFLAARCFYATNQMESAIAKLEKLTGIDSRSGKVDAKRATARDNIEAYMLLAMLLRENKQAFAEADEVVNAMVAANPKSAKALIQRSAFKMRYAQDADRKANAARIDAAKADLRDALQLEPKNVDALMQNAALDSMDKNYVAAGKHLEAALKIAPKDERVYLRLAGVLFMQGKSAEAIAKIEEGAKQLPQSGELLWALHEFQLRMNDVPAAKQTIDRMKKLKMMPERVHLAEARIPLVERNWQEASRQLEQVRPHLSLYPNLALSADLALGQCYANLRQPDRQLQLYNKILQADPNNIEALRGKAAALTSLLKYEEALAVYQQKLGRLMGPEAFENDRALMGGYYAVLMALSQRKGEDQDHFRRLGEKVRRKMLDQSDSPVEAPLVDVGKLLEGKKPAEASELLRKEIAAHPKEMRLRLALATVLASAEGLDAALASLDASERELGATAQSHAFRAELVARRGGPDVNARLAELERGLEKFTAQEQADVWARLGAHYYRLGRGGRDDVQRCWQQALKLRPDSAPLLEALFELARESNDQQAMQKARNDIGIQLGRDSGLWKYSEAARLLSLVRERGVATEAGNLDQARKLIEEAMIQRPEWHLLYRLQAEMEAVSNQPEAAMRDYQKALELGPPDAAVVQRLVELQLANGKFKEARQSLKKLGDGVVGLARLQILAEVLGGGDPAKALEKLEREVPEQSPNPSDHLWKGQLLLRLDQKDKAEAAFRRAAQAGPNLPQTWLALVEFLARFRTPAEAERVIREAENQLSEDQAPLVLAQCYAQMQANDRAEHYYLTALNIGPKTPPLVRTVAAFYLTSKQPQKAAPLLNLLIQSAPKLRANDQPHVAWARRELALLASQGPSLAELQNAVRLVEANASSGSAANSDALLIGRMYATRRDIRSLRRAQQMLEKLRNTPEFGFEEKLALATVYANTNDWAKGQNLLEELAADQPDDVRVINILAETLLKRKEPDAASKWVQRLEARQPKSPQTTRMRALLAMGRERPAEAEEIVVSALPKQPTAENAGQFVLGARILEDAKNYKAAEKLLRATVAVAPSVQWELANFLARRGRADEALAIIKPHVSDKTLEGACQIATVALREQKNAGGKIKDDQRNLVRSWFEQASKLPQKPPGLLMNQALFSDMLGESSAAEQSYRAILDRNDLPLHLKAGIANNLAYLLAVNGGDLAEAQKLCDFGLTQMGAAPELLDTLAMIALAKKENTKAIELLSEATEVGGTAELFYHLALAHQKDNNRAAAVRSLRRAREEGLRKEGLSQTDAKQLDALEAWLLKA